MKELYDYAKKKGCYKLVLQCKKENKNFMKNVGIKLTVFACRK